MTTTTDNPSGGPTLPEADRKTLTLDSLTVDRGGRPVVHDVSIVVTPGQITTMLGPNGAGKSTIAAAIAGLATIRSGTVTLGDRDVTGLRPERVRSAGISVVPEGRRLLTDLTVEDNLKVASYSLGSKVASEGLDYTLSLFPELEKRWNIGGRLLSGGEQQMVVLAQALVSRPAVLVVDELSLGLAPIVVKRLIPVLALGLATAAYVLESGRVAYSGTARELTDNPELLHSAYLLRD